MRYKFLIIQQSSFSVIFGLKKFLFQIAKQQLKHETKIAPGRKECTCTIWEIYQIKRPDVGNDMIRNSQKVRYKVTENN